MNPNLINIASKIIREQNDPNIAAKSKASRLENALENNGLTVEDVAREVRNMMNFAEKDSDKMKAIQLAADLNGLRKDSNVPQMPVINIVVQGDDTDVSAILIPSP